MRLGYVFDIKLKKYVPLRGVLSTRTHLAHLVVRELFRGVFLKGSQWYLQFVRITETGWDDR